MKFSLDIWQVVTILTLLAVAAAPIVRRPVWRYVLLSLAWTVGAVIKAVLIAFVVSGSTLSGVIAAATVVFLVILVAGAVFDRRGRFVLVAVFLAACGIIGLDLWTLS